MGETRMCNDKLLVKTIERLAPLFPAPTRLQTWWWRYGLPIVVMAIAIGGAGALPSRPPGVQISAVSVWLGVLVVALVGAFKNPCRIASLVAAAGGGVMISVVYFVQCSEPLGGASLGWLATRAGPLIGAAGIGYWSKSWR
jgi:hypothetical protein